MNALVGYRNNSLGNMSVTHSQRQKAAEEITSTFRAKLSATTAKSAPGTDATTSAKAATGSKATGDTTFTDTSKELGRDAFLQLLVLELQNQDPLEPVDNSDMIAQLAQFSSLEGIENLNGNIELLTGNVDQLNFISAQGLIGKYIEGVNDEGEVTLGKVDSVYLDGSIVVLNVEGEIVSMSNVLSISNEPLTESGSEGEENAADANEEKRGVLKRFGNSITNLFD